jgi:hypothetical protein
VTPCNPVETNRLLEETYTVRVEYKYSATLNIEVTGNPLSAPRNIGKFLPENMASHLRKQ